MIFEAMIVDDEAPARVELTSQLERTGRVKVVSEAVCLQEAIAKLRENRIDVAFIDHNIVGSGTTLLADALPTLAHVPMLIYMTAYSDYQDEPFGVQPLGYLAKPVDKRSLAAVIEEIEGCYKLEVGQR